MQPFQYICRQPRSPLNPLLYLSKWLQAHCKGVLSRILLIITQQGSEKVSIGDAPMGGPASTACAGARTREMHGRVGVIKQLRLTRMWDWIRMCLWSCACGRVCCQGFPWRCHSTGADPAGGKAMIYSFAAHISPSSNTSPAVFNLCLYRSSISQTTVKSAAASTFRMKVVGFVSISFTVAFNLVVSSQTASCCRCHANVFRPFRVSFSE